MRTKNGLDRRKNFDFTGINHSYLSTMERNARSNLVKLLFADDESVVSSSIREDPAAQNQIQSQDELKNLNPGNTMDTRENDNVLLEFIQC